MFTSQLYVDPRAIFSIMCKTPTAFIYLTVIHYGFKKNELVYINSILFNSLKKEIVSNIIIFVYSVVAKSAWAVEYTVCISAEGYAPSPKSVLDITVNNQIERLQ